MTGGCNDCRITWSCELARQLRRCGRALAPGICQRFVPPYATNYDFVRVLDLDDLALHLAKYTGTPEAWREYLRRSPNETT